MVARQRQLTGLDGPSTAAMFGRMSLSQPDDLVDDGIEDENHGESIIPEVMEPDQVDITVPQILGIEDPDEPGQSKMIPVPDERGTKEDIWEGGRLSAKIKSSSPDTGRNTFVTARQDLGSSPANDTKTGERFDGPSDNLSQRLSANLDQRTSASLTEPASESSPRGGRTSPLHAATSSTTSLIPRKKSDARSFHKKSNESLRKHEPSPIPEGQAEEVIQPVIRSSTGIRFVEGVGDRKDRAKVKLTRAQQRASTLQLRRNTLQEGAVIKMEKMLVRIDTTRQDVSPEYDENDSQKLETKLVEKWREYMVVVRQNHEDDSDFRLQLYRTRVIPAVDNGSVRKKCKHEIRLNPKNTRVNLFSSLDKTVVIWHPYRKGSRFCIVRPRSAAHSVEWYTFLRGVLGWSRPSVLVVNVPDLSLSLRLEDVFKEVESTRDAVEQEDNDDDPFVVQDAIAKKTMDEEKAVAGRIISRCLEMLSGNPEWADVLMSWSKAEKMGLAWKRYDRLEWVHGVNEQKMYGSMAMQRSHDLELRPKQHYLTNAIGKKGKVHQEPPPVEGFLIRLTSQKGAHKRLGKMFFKRLYFSTQNQYLVFGRPARTTPPHPPKLEQIDDSNVPSSSEIVHKMPMMYDVEPYPLNNGEIRWLKSGNKAFVTRHDQEAFEEYMRNIDNLTKSDGYIDMCKIRAVRNIKWGATEADEEIEEGSDDDVEFHQEVSDTQRDDGVTDKIDDERVFEIVLANDLVIRLQAFDETTKNAWVQRLKALVKYWKLRTNEDMAAFKDVRRANLDKLKISEEMEAAIGQFARKWEVVKSDASPQLYHMCGIGCCRPITMSGLLYRKPRKHSSFVRCGVMLVDSKLLIFQGSLRKRTGVEIPHIHQEHQHSLDLQDCYVYSGLITEDDLLYHNQTFDSNHPGMHALPRVYLDDGWTSQDQDTMTCWVLWHGYKRSFFRADEDEEGGGKRQRLRQVSRLGVPGRSMVFKCRSRAERDHWVMNISMAIDRLQQTEDVRLQSQD